MLLSVEAVDLLDRMTGVLFGMEINETASYLSLYQRLRPCGTSYSDSVAESTDQAIV